MKNKDKVYNELKLLTEKIDIDSKIGITSTEIADNLKIRRNVVSQFLNELCEKGLALKINTRPVYFLDKEVYESKKLQFMKNKKIKDALSHDNNELSSDPFKKLIGYNNSLKIQVEQCKSAASYHPNGLPILLIGETGVGKSLIAKIIYEYAKQQKFISKDAPYVVFNCAEYANNQELLSANLFGYKKGAFTGADMDKAGLLEEADGGYLFLDEVHRLPPEGQEKLFLFLDQNIFRRLGEVGKWRSANVRLVFATTESPEKSLLKTFLRRIPIIAKIPALSSRTIYERLQIVCSFYRQEALNIKKDILISKQVLNILLRYDMDGNIGRLVNIIKYSCAHAYNQSQDKKIKKITIHLNDFPKDITLDYINENKEFYFNDILVKLNEKEEYVLEDMVEGYHNDINENINEIIRCIKEYDNKKISKDKLQCDLMMYLNEFSDKVIFKDEKYRANSNTFYEINKVIENVLKIIESYYGIEFYGNSLDTLACMLDFLLESIFGVSEEEKLSYEEAAKILKRIFSKDYIISEKILGLVETNLDVKLDYRAQIYFTIYINYLNKDNKANEINSIIIAHGYSTASSIASVANRLLGHFIFEAFDMPIELPTKEIMGKVQKYLSSLDTSRGIMILVDMGSLEEIYKPLIDITNGDIGIINNITTQLALDVGNRITRGQSIEEIINETSKNNSNYFKYIKLSNFKKNAIITTCITGIGTATKIKNMLLECFGSEEIEIIAYDYKKLKADGINNKVFNIYNVRLIVGTADPQIQQVPYLSLEDLIGGKGEAIISQLIQDFSHDITFEEINKALIKMFSLQNVLNTMTILNPDKILNQVEMAVSNLELCLGYKFTNPLKISLYIHVCCLIERVMINEPISLNSDIDEFEKCHRHFVKAIKSSFSVIENKYNVNIPMSEIEIVYEIIHSKMSNMNI